MTLHHSPVRNPVIARPRGTAAVSCLQALALFCALAFSTTLQAAPISSAHVGSLTSESACSLGSPTSDTASTSSLSFSTAELSTAACFATASADAGNGSLHVHSFANGQHVVVVCPGCGERSPLMQSQASAGLSEVVRPAYSHDLNDPDIATISVPVTIFVSATVSAGASSDLSFVTSAVDYTVTVQGQTLAGSKLIQSSNTPGEAPIESESGVFGVQTFIVLLTPAHLDYDLSMTVSSTARLDGRGSGFPFGATATADADFSHTLRWMGISGPITARNATGDVVALPADFAIDMMGQTTGFNYRNAAPVPEPAEWALALAGLAALRLRFTAQRRRAVAKGHQPSSPRISRGCAPATVR